MVREIITPQSPIVTVRLPEEMVGKTVEVIAFEIEPEITKDNKLTKEKELQRIRDLTSSSLIDLSNFKFDRNEANNYDE
jgi:hypothetical protein